VRTEFLFLAVYGGLLVASAAAWAQPARSTVPTRLEVDPSKLCTLEGRTVNARTGEPVPRVSLSLIGAQSGVTRGGRSDENGNFKIENIPPGTYRLIGERVGFLRQGYGSRTPGGQGAPLNLTEGQYLKGLEFRLTPQGVILGLILDEHGDPQPYATVMAYSADGTASAGIASAGRMGGQAGTGAASTATANDVGEFRLAGLAPGRYLILASSSGRGAARGPALGRGMAGRGAQSGGEEEAPLPTYYPSVTDPAAAVPVEVGPGQEIGGINITLRSGSLFIVAGRITNAASQDLSGMMVMLVPRSTRPGLFMNRGAAQVRADGTFEIARVAPGSYYLLVQRTGRQAGPGIAGKVMVDVAGADVSGLLVPVTEPVSVNGAVKIEGQSEGASLQRIMVTLIPADGLPVGSPGARVADTGAFKIDSVFPDRYFLNVSGLPETVYIKAVRLGGQDATQRGIDLSSARSGVQLELTLSTKASTIEGTVTLDDQPATGAYVAVLADPLRPERSYLNKFAVADQDGRFTIRGLAPGDYRVYAFEEAPAGLARDPGLATPYERHSVKIDLDEGESKRVELRAIRRETGQP